MTNFFIDDKFYSELIDFIEDEGWELEDVLCFDDDIIFIANESKLEKLVDFNTGWITEQLENRLPEDDYFYDQICKIFNDNIDFEKINSLLPDVIIPLKKTFKITKGDLIEELS